MSVRKRKWTDKNGRHQEAWMIHIEHTHPDGTRQVIRKTSPVQTRRGAEQYERELRESLLDGSSVANKQGEETPVVVAALGPMTVSEFVETFLDEYSRTEGLRPRYIQMQRVALQMHIVPVVGEEQVERVGTKHFGMVKRAMLKKNPDYSGKTVNNVLSVLSRMVRFWWEREGLAAPHFNAGLLKLDEVEAAVYEPDVFERLVEGARAVGQEELAIVLTMGDAGLRQGELRGLYMSDVRFNPPIIRVQRALSTDGEEHSQGAPQSDRADDVTARRSPAGVHPSSASQSGAADVRSGEWGGDDVVLRSCSGQPSRAGGEARGRRPKPRAEAYVRDGAGRGRCPGARHPGARGACRPEDHRALPACARAASTCGDPEARAAQRHATGSERDRKPRGVRRSEQHIHST